MNCIKYEMCFSCGSDVVTTAKEYNDTMGKVYKCCNSSGQKNHYNSTDPQCPLKIVTYVKKGCGKKTRPLIAITERYCYLLQFTRQGGSCQSRAKISAKLLSEITTTVVINA